jgi:hypothetical protein
MFFDYLTTDVNNFEAEFSNLFHVSVTEITYIKIDNENVSSTDYDFYLEPDMEHRIFLTKGQRLYYVSTSSTNMERIKIIWGDDK